MYKVIRLFQFRGFRVALVRFNDKFQVEVEDMGKGGYVYEFYSLPEAEELYNSEVNIGLVVKTK